MSRNEGREIKGEGKEDGDWRMAAQEKAGFQNRCYYEAPGLIMIAMKGV